MKYIIALFSLTFAMACSQNDLQSQTLEPASSPNTLVVSMYDSPLINPHIALKKPYELSFAIEEIEGSEYNLVVNMELFGGSFYVSPHSNRDFKGKFRVELADYKELLLGDFEETPRSKEVIDPHHFVDGPVNWVQEDTKYEYKLTRTSDEDFEVGGKIIFTIEPKCTLEVIGIIIKYRSGVLIIEALEC